MDPLPVAYGCVSLIAEVTRLTMSIPIFVANVRIARKDMDALLRELASLQLCLNALKDDDQSAPLNYPQSLNHQINQLLANTETVVKQLNNAIIKSSSRKGDGTISWSSSDRREVVHCRSILVSNRLALDLTLTMGTITKMIDQRVAMKGRRGSLEKISEATLSAPGISVIFEEDADTPIEALQLDTLKQEIGDFRSQFSDLSAPNVYEDVQAFNSEALTYTKTLLEPFPDLHAELVCPKNESTLSPSTSVSTATSSSAFTKRSHSLSSSTTSAEIKFDEKKCPACARSFAGDDRETVLRNFYEKQSQARSTWQKQLRKEQDEVMCLQEEITRLQEANSSLQSGRQKDLDNRMNEALREKDELIKELQSHFRATSFFISVRTKGLDTTIEDARKDFAEWERLASTLPTSRIVDDPSMSTGAPDEDGSDTTTIEQPPVVPRRPLRNGSGTPMTMNISPIQDIHEQVIFEFSVNFIREDLALRSLSGLHRSLVRPVVIHCYKQWATVDAVIREVLRSATEHCPPLILDPNAGPCYLTKVTQRYDDVINRPIVDVQPLWSDHLVANLKILHGDKIRLMQGPLGFHLATNQTHNIYRQSPSVSMSSVFEQRPATQRSRSDIASLDENLPEVIPGRSPNISPSSVGPTHINPTPGITHIRSGSGDSYNSSQPNIVVSSYPRAMSEFSGFSTTTRISQPPNALTAAPIFEFRVDKTNSRIHLKPRSLITNHSNYYSRLGPPSSVHTDFMISILKQVSVDPVHFTDNDDARGMFQYITELLSDLLSYWSYDLNRILLQIRSSIIHKADPLRNYHIEDSCSIWVMLKPFKPWDNGNLGYSSSDLVPSDQELWIEQPDLSVLQRLSFNDPNFRRIYAARKHARSGSHVSVRSREGIKN